VIDSIVDEYPGESGMNVCANLINTVVGPGQSVECLFTINGYVPQPGGSIKNTVTVTGHAQNDPDSKVQDSDPSIVNASQVLAPAREEPREEPSTEEEPDLAFTGFQLFGLLLIALSLLGAGVLAQSAGRLVARREYRRMQRGRHRR
jgi:hypothetical protein